MAPVPPLIDPALVAPFVDPLLQFPKRAVPLRPGSVPLYRIPIAEFQAKVHRDVPPTRFWGYGGSVPGPTLEIRSGQPIEVEWPNQLPQKHFLPIDHNLMGAEKNKPESRAIVHVHGARVPA